MDKKVYVYLKLQSVTVFDPKSIFEQVHNQPVLITLL